MSDQVKKIDDGGPAFARASAEHSMGGNYEQDGMSLRDWFASQADIPWNAVIETLSIKGIEMPTVKQMAEYRALMKYAEADAMIAARKGGAA
ncbi:hypothetical protein I7G86_13925 [Sinorhizobium meliloti]|uniref:hypothetical protein n=1 Tax=Rhizobium meliloti TaxID=382 RepID=UPI000301D06B|nr:hypothetical protein [Sinorhizobium meliloti]MDE3791732.1 hypothetical protein [Sinorhizobium meliloti]